MAVRKNKSRKVSYKNYVKRYKEKQAIMKRRGLTMASDMMTYREYKANRALYVDSGVTQNINQTMVADQQYEFSIGQARSLKEKAKELDLSFAKDTLASIRRGSNVRNEDLIEINNRLKELASKFPDTYSQFLTGTGRAEWIKENIFWDIDSD